jgi:endonuclease-8
MPEGTSIVILREEAAAFVERTTLRVDCNAKIDMRRLPGHRVHVLRSLGKQVELSDELTVRIPMLMSGSHRIKQVRDIAARLNPAFEEGELNFQNCPVRPLDDSLDSPCDWRADVMSDHRDSTPARANLRDIPRVLVCDALLGQSVFADAGNITRNEVLFRTRIHPPSMVGALSRHKLRKRIEQEAHVLARHWPVRNRGRCPRHAIPLQRAYPGRPRRRGFCCLRCPKLHAGD